MNLKIIKILFTILVTSATIIFFAKTFIGYQEQAQSILFSTPPIKITIALIIFIIQLYMHALSWRFIVFSLGESIPKKTSLAVWFLSEATRYIPVGRIWSFASRAYLAQQNKVSARVSYLILPMEIIIVSTSATILSSYAIVKTLEKLPVNLSFYVLLAAVMIGVLVFSLMNKALREILKKIFVNKFSPAALFNAFALQSLSWVFYIAGYIVLIDNIASVDNILLLCSTILLSWLAGYLSIVSPMGIGIRESVFVLLVGSQIGTAQALSVAVLSRVLLITAELINLSFWVLIRKRFLSF